MAGDKQVEDAYRLAKERYAALGVYTDAGAIDADCH